ncbi:MAG: hypothetical protein QGG40_22075 [Myxococcota bacterium]|nr:hypothetical protein [Myxococcota bacterium]
MRRWVWLAAVLLVGCEDNGSGKVGSGELEDTADDFECVATIAQIEPEDGTESWYYLDPVLVTFTDDGREATATLLDADGNEVPSSLVLSAENLLGEVVADDGLTGGESYTLQVEVCEDSGSAAFTTSVYGAGLDVEPEDLVGRTYIFDFGEASYLEPEGLTWALELYMNAPLLFGIQAADATSLDILLAQGTLKNDGTYKQDTALQTWAFEGADFSAAPFFAADTESVTIDYSGIEIPFEDFHVEGTFAPDAESIGGGLVQAIADTRYMGPLLNLDDEVDSICNMAADLKVDCIECSDGNPYCLPFEAYLEEAPWQEDLAVEASEE